MQNPSPDTPAARRRMARAATLAGRMQSLFARGITGEALVERLHRAGPADIDRTADGHYVRCYGLQTPPCATPTAAILTWAAMAQGGAA